MAAGNKNRKEHDSIHLIKTSFLLVFLYFNVFEGISADNASNWNTTELSTAANSRFLSQFEKEIILEVNMLRSNPSKYAADFIVPLKTRYKKRLLYYPGDLPLQTKEGINALEECVKVLQTQKKLTILRPDAGLTKAAEDHVKDQSRSGQTGHKGSDGSGFRNRIEKYGKWKFRIAENIAYGGISARQVLIYLLIDDGIPGRGHRVNFLNPDFKLIGVATGIHPEYKKMCVMEFAAGFESIQSYVNR